MHSLSANPIFSAYEADVKMFDRQPNMQCLSQAKLYPECFYGVQRKTPQTS